MITDIWTITKKEWRELLLQQSSFRGSILSLLIFLGIFGIMLPWQTGPSWVSSPTALAYWVWLPMFMASSVVADAFAGERERHTLETLLASRLSNHAILFGKVIAAIGYAWGFMIIGLVIGVITVNVAHGHGRFLMYDSMALIAILGAGLLTAWLVSAAGVLVSLRASTVRQAQQLMMVAILAIVFVPIVLIQVIPSGMKAQIGQLLASDNPFGGVVVLVVGVIVVDVALTVAGMVWFKRSRLIGD
jgi:ABC-2 type transport system permease protein